MAARGGVPRPTNAGRSLRRVPVTLLLATFAVALMGRFTLDRLGVEQFGELDLRLVAFPVLAVAVLLWRFRPDAEPGRHPWVPPLGWALALCGFLALTGFWAPAGARLAERLSDVALLALLVVLVAVVSAPRPPLARRVVLAAMFGSGLLYALAGLLIGETDAQGRTTAFGGGPNVYIRVVLLGILAAVALAVMHRRRLLLLPVPIMGVAAVVAGSRGGVLAAAATGVAFVLLFGRRLSWPALAGTALVGGVGLVAAPALLDPEATGLLQDRFIRDLVEQEQYSGRPELFGQAYAVFRDSPLVGSGLDSFYVRFGSAQDLDYPHNLILEVATTGGLVGLTLLAAFAASFARSCRPLARLTPDQVAMVLAAVFVAVASMSSGDFYDTRFLWIFAILAVNAPVRAPTAVAVARARS